MRVLRVNSTVTANHCVCRNGCSTPLPDLPLVSSAPLSQPLGRTSCAGDVNCPEVATPSISQVVATRSSGIAAFGTHSTSIAQESATTGCARARPAAILVSAGDKENHDPFPVKEACFPPPRPATAVPDATSSTTAPSGSTLPLLDNELKPVDQATGNLGAMNSCVEKPAGGLAWDPLGVMTGDNKGCAVTSSASCITVWWSAKQDSFH